MRTAYDQMAGSAYSVGAYRSAERLYVISTLGTSSGIPVLFAHGALDTAAAARTATVFNTLEAIANVGGHVVLAGDLGTGGGMNTFANDDSVDAAEDLLAWAGTNLGTRTDRVVFVGDSMGSLLVLNLAMSNPARVAAMVLRGPVFDFQAFHDRVAAFQAPIHTAYTNEAGYLAALPTKDPARNLSKLRPLGRRMGVWAALSDEFIPIAEPRAFCSTLGARLTEMSGTHVNVVDSSPFEVAEFIERTVSTP